MEKEAKQEREERVWIKEEEEEELEEEGDKEEKRIRKRKWVEWDMTLCYDVCYPFVWLPSVTFV